MFIGIRSTSVLLAIYSAQVVLALQCQLYSGDNSVIREIEFTSNADFPASEDGSRYNATVKLLPGAFEDQTSSLVMEHDGFACPKTSNKKAVCGEEAGGTHSGCVRSFYVKDKCKQSIAASISNGPESSFSFQARQSDKVWLVGAAQTCAIKEYTPEIASMKAVVFASEGVHTWASARVYLDKPYLGLSKSWQCDYDDHLLPDTPSFEPQEGGKVWQLRAISFQKR